MTEIMPALDWTGKSFEFANAVSAIIGIARTRNNDATIIEILVFLFIKIQLFFFKERI